MDSIRALLDNLMGPDRNGDVKPREVGDYKDSRVCKSYLLGYCPHDMLAGSKGAIGPCGKLHDSLLKKMYEKDPEHEKLHYEQILRYDLREQVRQCDRKIKRNRDRFPENPDTVLKMEEYDDVKMLNEEIDKIDEQIEQLEKMGKADLAQEMKARREERLQIKASLQSMHLKEEQEKLPPEVQPLTATPAQKNRICNVCGGMLSIFDVDKRLADHFVGKAHLAYLAIRKKLKQLEEQAPTEEPVAEEKPESETRHRSRSRSRSHSHRHHSYSRNRREESSSRRRRSRSRSRSGHRTHSHRY